MRGQRLERLVIDNHARQGVEHTGAIWDAFGDAVRIGIVDRLTDRDIRMPTRAAPPHLSLVLLTEGRGHFLMGSSGARPCEFKPGHAYLSCGWEPFDAEDFIPAHARFRAVLMNYPLNLRALVDPVISAVQDGGHRGAVHRHPLSRAWLAAVPMPDRLAALAESTIRAGLDSSPLGRLEMQGWALQALHAVTRELSTPALPIADGPDSFTARERRALLAASRYIDEAMARPLRIADIATAAGVSPTVLKQGFRAMFGTTVHAHLVERRCRRAADLLRDPALSIGEIAQRCGFASISHLSRHFARRFEVTPRVYRARLD